MKSPAHILLVIYERESQRFDDMVKEAVGESGNWTGIWLGGCAAVLTNSGRVDGAVVKVATVHEGQHTFDCVKAFVVLSHHKRWERCGLEI